MQIQNRSASAHLKMETLEGDSPAERENNAQEKERKKEHEYCDDVHVAICS